MGKLIIFEGLDGSGKGTQAELACQNLHSKGYDPLKISFPDYDSPSSALVKMYLSGEFGQRPDDVNAYAASTFYAVDRFASYKTRWGNVYRQNGLIISDRYTTSNAVHQCSKLPPMHWDGFLEWLFEFEYKKLGLPAPDAVVYLAVDPDVSQRLIAQRYHGDESKKDIQERDTEYLARSRAAAEPRRFRIQKQQPLRAPAIPLKIRIAGAHVFKRNPVDIPQCAAWNNALPAEKAFRRLGRARRLRAFIFGTFCDIHQPLAQIPHSAISLSVSRSAVFLPCSPTSFIGPVQEGHPASQGQRAIKSWTSLKISARMPKTRSLRPIPPA